MTDIQSYIDSGVLELHAAGVLPSEEAVEVERLADAYPEIKAAMHAAQAVCEQLIQAAAMPAPRHLKKNVMAAIDEAEGRDSSLPPMLHPRSNPQDFTSWVNRFDAGPPDGFGEMFYIEMAHEDGVQTALVWIKDELHEVPHTHFIERFLILEGSCVIDVEGTRQPMHPGDYLEIPRFKHHTVIVPAGVICKCIVQRTAA